MEFDVVIAGGGFAGAYCARALGRAFGKDEGEERVALIAERNVLVFQPMIPEVAGSTLAPADVVNPLRIFCRGVNVLQGTIQKIDWESKTILLDGGRTVEVNSADFSHDFTVTRIIGQRKRVVSAKCLWRKRDFRCDSRLHGRNSQQFVNPTRPSGPEYVRSTRATRIS